MNKAYVIHSVGREGKCKERQNIKYDKEGGRKRRGGDGRVRLMKDEGRKRMKMK